MYYFLFHYIKLIENDILFGNIEVNKEVHVVKYEVSEDICTYILSNISIKFLQPLLFDVKPFLIRSCAVGTEKTLSLLKICPYFSECVYFKQKIP